MDQDSDHDRSEGKETIDRLLNLGDAVFRLTQRLRAHVDSGAATADELDEWNNAQQAYVLAVYEARSAVARLVLPDSSVIG